MPRCVGLLILLSAAVLDCVQAFAACSCSNCEGKRNLADMPTDGFKGFQCTPNSDGFKLGSCTQQGGEADWAVQSSSDLAYERFCHYTCRPLIPRILDPYVPCEMLTLTEIKAFAQSPSGNGRAYVYHSNPLRDSYTLNALPQLRHPPLISARVDPITMMRRALDKAHRSDARLLRMTAPHVEECECKCLPPPAVETSTTAAPVLAFKVPPTLPPPPPPPGVPPPPPPVAIALPPEPPQDSLPMLPAELPLIEDFEQDALRSSKPSLLQAKRATRQRLRGKTGQERCKPCQCDAAEQKVEALIEGEHNLASER
mmetsp:Transcript_13876/g.25529  ORF Transcript_13876/g.25529 Transcript_13876/m.25529 type:complete len:313 (-) Transcript_13876:49-987(-)